jgi:hypothetical protein
MSSNVFLAPCDEGNDRTIRSEVDLSKHPSRPEEFSEIDTIRFWGVREGPNNESYFERMDSGDLVLFYQNGNSYSDCVTRAAALVDGHGMMYSHDTYFTTLTIIVYGYRQSR